MVRLDYIVYSVWECHNCEKENKHHLYALMPVPISYNGNHDIFYTGGKDYLYDEEDKKFAEELFKKIKPSIDQYIRRKLNPENNVDETLSEWNYSIWCSRDVEYFIVEWLYKHGMKK